MEFSMAVRLVFLSWIVLALNFFLAAQAVRPIVLLQLDSQPRTTQVPPQTALGNVQCDGSGAIEVRYAAQTGNAYSSGIARVEPDASTQIVSLSPLPGAPSSSTFIFATGDDASLYEILRAPDSGQLDAAAAVQYVRFDADGALRASASFEQEFIPSMLVPLPSGNFFASGVTVQRGDDSVKETSVAGIFNSDAKLLRHLRSDSQTVMMTDGKRRQSHDVGEIDPQAGTARLGGDGNIYILLAGDHANVAVATQAGRIIRQMTLWEPFETSVASDMWVSGNRLLVTYEGETDDPKDSFVYVLYDAQSGEVIRAYRPQFAGTLACFEGGQTVSVLLHEPTTGAVTVATADLQ
jgi:hypothetical protein